MKAVLLHKYGGPEELSYSDFADPVPGPGEVLVRVAAVSINPFDVMIRSGQVQSMISLEFPAILGIDVAGVVEKVGDGVNGFNAGEKVFAMTNRTYAELCVVKASDLAKVPDGMDLQEIAALPLVTTTGEQLISLGTGASSGQRVLVSGAAGNVGRSAVYAAKQRGAHVIAGVLKRHLGDPTNFGANEVLALDDESAMAKLKPVDAVADTVGHKTAESLLGVVKDGGVFASVLGQPANAATRPNVRKVEVYAKSDAKTIVTMALAVKSGKLIIPIVRKLALREAAQGQIELQKGVNGKILLLV